MPWSTWFGDDLKAVLARLTCPFTPRETARLIKAVALILEYTHGRVSSTGT